MRVKRDRERGESRLPRSPWSIVGKNSCSGSFDTSQTVVRAMAEVWSNCGDVKEGETWRARQWQEVDRQEASGMSGVFKEG